MSRRSSGAKRILWAVAGLCATTAACAVFPPVGTTTPPAMSVYWASSLYELEAFAYDPFEIGQPAFAKSKTGPAGGIVVVPSKDRQVRALDAASGKVLWSLATKGPNYAQPVITGDDGDELIVASLDGHVYRTYLRNGKPIWVSKHPGKAGIRSRPLVTGGQVYVSSIDNRLTALSYETGERLWERRRPHSSEFTISGQAGATRVGDAIVTGFSTGHLEAFSPKDGATLWSVDLSEGKTEFVDVDTTPVVVDGPDGNIVVAGSYRRGLFGIDGETGNILWLMRGEGYLTPAVMDGVLYVPQANGRLVAVDGSTGVVMWVSKFSGGWANTPAVSDSYVYVPDSDALVVLDRTSGRTVVRFDDSRGFSAPPEFAWGTAYVQSNSGMLYALDVYQ